MKKQHNERKKDMKCYYSSRKSHRTAKVNVLKTQSSGGANGKFDFLNFILQKLN